MRASRASGAPAACQRMLHERFLCFWHTPRFSRTGLLGVLDQGVHKCRAGALSILHGSCCLSACPCSLYTPIEGRPPVAGHASPWLPPCIVCIPGRVGRFRHACPARSLLLQVRAWQKSQEGQAALAKKRKSMGRAIKLLAAKPPALITSSPDPGSQQLSMPPDPGPPAGMPPPAANAAVSAFMRASSKGSSASNKQPRSPSPPQAGPTASD